MNYIKLAHNGFKNKEHYINTLISSNVSYKSILELLEADRNCLFSDVVKNKIIELLNTELQTENNNM